MARHLEDARHGAISLGCATGDRWCSIKSGAALAGHHGCGRRSKCHCG